MHRKWLYFRHKLFRYREVEQALAAQPNVRLLLDVGCGDGEYLLRFRHLPIQRFGLEMSFSRLRTARQQGLAVVQGSGEILPFPDNSIDMIYLAHVLHHVGDYERVLAEIGRCLKPDGYLFMVESVSDNPLLRLVRKVRPVWQGDSLEWNWRYEELTDILQKAGYDIEQSERYNLVFFLWEMLPLAFWPFELFTPIFVYLDLFLAKLFSRYSAHCYFVSRNKAKV